MEVFGEDNFVALITLTKAASQSSQLLAGVNDYIVLVCKEGFPKSSYRGLYEERPAIDNPTHRYICVEEPDGTIHDLNLKQKLGELPIPQGLFLRIGHSYLPNGFSSLLDFGQSFKVSLTGLQVHVGGQQVQKES